jgi:ferredoxin
MALASRRTSSHDVCLKRVVTDTPIKKVWIEEGCISCKLCEDIVPQVFEVPDDEDCIVKSDAATHFGPLSEDICQAADDCPVEVIQVERAGD